MRGMSILTPKLSRQLFQSLYFNILDLLMTSSMFVGEVHVTCGVIAGLQLSY